MIERRLPYIDNKLRRIRALQRHRDRLELAAAVLSFALATCLALVPVALAYWQMGGGQ